MKKVVILIVGMGAVLFFPNFSRAAGPIGITVAPPKYIIETDPGQVHHKEIIVINPNNFPMEVRPEFQDFKITEGNNIQWIPGDVENPFRITDWIEISVDSITLAPNGDAKIPFSIRVPKDASAGGHYGAVFFTPVIDESGDIGSVPRVGALVILNVSGDISRTGEMTGFKSPIIVTSGPVMFKLDFLNTGTTHYESEGEILVRGITGGKTVLTTEKKFVYPNISREIKALWDVENPFGIYWVKATILDGAGKEYVRNRIMIAIPLLKAIVALFIFSVLYVMWRSFKKRFKIVKT